MIGTFTRRLAVETPDGVSVEFSAPESWVGTTVYVAVNNVVLTGNFTFAGFYSFPIGGGLGGDGGENLALIFNNSGVIFKTAPRPGDVIEFLYTPASGEG